jgi:hypothetical protein
MFDEIYGIPLLYDFSPSRHLQRDARPEHVGPVPTGRLISARPNGARPVGTGPTSRFGPASGCDTMNRFARSLSEPRHLINESPLRRT